MTEKNMIDWEQDADGIVVLTMDDPNQSTNTMNDLCKQSFVATVDRLYGERESVTGVVLTSAKKTFFAGGDLRRTITIGPDQAHEVLANVEMFRAMLRRLETLGRPVVAAINGAALGGGLEIALATHHRIAADVEGVKIGFPESTLGMLPGGGGVVRTVRMLGLQDAVLRVLVPGGTRGPAEAKDMGLVDQVVSSIDELVPAAKDWIKANPEGGVQPWDRAGYRIPGGAPATPALAAILPALPANLRKQFRGAPMPAPRAIMAAAVEGSQVDFDTAMIIEARYFTSLVTGQVAKNMMQAFFFDQQAIRAGASRPTGIAKTPITKVGVLGAGPVGAGIAYLSAKAGFEVVLGDVAIETAMKGKSHAEDFENKALSDGRSAQGRSEALLARITPTADAADFAGVDLVVETAFESVESTHRAFQEIEDIVEPNALLCSSTATLPVSGRAAGVKRQEDFLGFHFLSPVDEVPLVEIIRGEKTSDEALARAFDYVQSIRRTPIVVNDTPGFFVSRLLGTYVNEAITMLAEGVEPASVEQAGLQAGYSAAPLQLADEVGLALIQGIREDTEALVGEPTVGPVVECLVDGGRTGRLGGAGFYDYADGKRVGLWPGLRERFDSGSATPPLRDLIDRVLFIVAIEAVTCFDEGVITSTADANIGSIMGIGYPAWTGGVSQFVTGYEGGKGGFVARAEELAAKYGERFQPPTSLR
ncbi:3-hydroxyacyl-CoA dehydrogenase [Rhodococcus sp. SC4]|nr:3-hydroxyacyl-CoA dehydrogenase [Rhodococcus sp. SC4]KXX61882.1 3-hydroxyacyl-CoA dehydrogenase [Rhodococcus sp. LB1]